MDPSDELEPIEPDEIRYIESTDRIDGEYLLPPSAPSIGCWRCHKDYPQDLLACPFCGGKNRLTQVGRSQIDNEIPEKTTPIKIVLVTYGIMLAGSIAFAIMLREGAGIGGVNESDIISATTALEVVDTIVVLIAMGMTGLAMSRIDPVPSVSVATTSWLLFGVGLVGMILVNLGYHRMLMEILNIPKAEGMYPDSWPILIILFCVQPAIVEELFARQMSLAVFRKYMGIHFAVFITAIMFAMMHIFVPLSVPYLFLLGVFLGYARVFGGTVFLPMVLHFAHNLVVIIYDKS